MRFDQISNIISFFHLIYAWFLQFVKILSKETLFSSIWLPVIAKLCHSDEIPRDFVWKDLFSTRIETSFQSIQIIFSLSRFIFLLFLFASKICPFRRFWHPSQFEIPRNVRIRLDRVDEHGFKHALHWLTLWCCFPFWSLFFSPSSWWLGVWSISSFPSSCWPPFWSIAPSPSSYWYPFWFIAA
jgi:hypothetical protein